MTEHKSWWLKFDRAQDRRQEAEAMVAAGTVERPVRIVKAQKADGNWAYTVHHDAVLDPRFPIVLGDFLFNLRSALDHIAAANRLQPTRNWQFANFNEVRYYHAGQHICQQSRMHARC